MPTTNGEVWKKAFCRRCGQLYEGCPHINTGSSHGAVSPEHAGRIRARYAIGKRFNPDHDEADYTDGPALTEL